MLPGSLRSFWSQTTPLNICNKRESSVKHRSTKKYTKKLQPNQAKVDSFKFGLSYSLTPNPITYNLKVKHQELWVQSSYGKTRLQRVINTIMIYSGYINSSFKHFLALISVLRRYVINITRNQLTIDVLCWRWRCSAQLDSLDHRKGECFLYGLEEIVNDYFI